MARKTLFPGVEIGPHNVFFIEEFPKSNKGRFKCINCDNTFISNKYNVKKGDRRFCDKCSKKYAKQIGKKYANDPKRKQNAFEAVAKIKPGKVFGHLMVLEKTTKQKNGKRIWKCQCDCENNTIIEVRSDLLLNGHTQSCGCLCSLGEAKISNLLLEKGLSFERQKQFSDCINPKTEYSLRFDFYLPDYNTCIEYDGKQHFIYTSGWFNKLSFQELQYRDNIKNQYCEEKGINLIRIPYWDYENIDWKYIEQRIKK